ncbi:VOC family protein [Qaidamihabitans albus]|uniref:VOC family protein n=1 Tax=Qaidamihabitans albus TaxID=2795733 RepID=UPI0018F18C73|nr:VOC family protein [Qaidamihabitans albus]
MSAAPTKVFINLPVQDLGKSIAFFEQLGFSNDKNFTDENAGAIVISDTIHVMLLKEQFFQTFTKKEIADATKSTEAIVCLSAESRAAVDELADKALAAGGQPANDPQDHGFMYGRSFQDLDGHHWEIMWMDPSAAQQ